MPYDFHKLQMIRCRGAISVRVPARWQCQEEQEGQLWSCFEDGVESGTLWITLLHYDTNEDEREPSVIVRDQARQLREAEDDGALGAVIELAPGNILWTSVSDSRDDEGTIRNFSHTFVLAARGQFAYIKFKLVIPVELLDNPEFRDLVAMMDREVRAASLYPFDLDGTFIEPLQRRYFGGTLALDLPNTMRRQMAEDRSNDHQQHWYCYFPPDLPARMLVDILDQGLAGEDEEPISIDPEHYEGFVEEFGNLEDQRQYDMREMPGGILIHTAFDLQQTFVAPSGEPDDSTPAWFAEPQRCHEWRYLRFSHGQVRSVTFFLFFPLLSMHEAAVIALVEALDRAIPGSQFPDLEAVNDSDD